MSDHSTPEREVTSEPLHGENLRLLWSFIRPHRRTLTLGLVLGLGTTAVALVTPLAVKRVLDTLGEGASLAGPVTLLVIALMIGAIASLAQTVVLGTLAERIVFDVRAGLVRRFVRGRVPDVQRHAPGELVSRVTSDTVLLREAAAQSIVQIANGAVSLVGTVILMAVLDIPLLLTTLTAVVGIFVLMSVLLPRIGAAQRASQAALGTLGAELEGSVRALRTVKAARAEQRQLAHILDQAESARRHSVRAVRVTALVWTAAGGGVQLAVILILAIGAWRVNAGGLEVSTLIAFLLYVFQLMEPIGNLSNAFTHLQAGVAAAARLREMDTVAPEAPEPPTAEAPTAEAPTAGAPTAEVPHRGARNGAADGPLLVVDRIRITYPGASGPALRDLSLTIPRCGHTAVVGPSGAGKTSLFSVILRFVEPDSGRLLLDGVPYEQLGLAAVRSRFAYVEQETPLVAGTVRDNVLFRWPDADEHEAWAALVAVRMEATVRALPQGLDTPVLATQLSGGERQRIALARAIVRDPDVLLLDEATAQLDGLTEAAVQDVIARVARRGAVITIAHRLSTVVDADQIVLLDRGTVRAIGTHRQLVAGDEMYRELVAALRIADDQPVP